MPYNKSNLCSMYKMGQIACRSNECILPNPILAVFILLVLDMQKQGLESSEEITQGLPNREQRRWHTKELLV